MNSIEFIFQIFTQFSVSQSMSKQTIKLKIILPKLNTNTTDCKVQPHETKVILSEPNLSEPIQLCQMLSIERNHDEVGACLFNINCNLLPSWIAFCSQSSQYQIGQCESKWEQMAKSDHIIKFDINDLHQWAQEDSPENYLNLTYDRIYFNYFKAKLEITDYHLDQIHITKTLTHLIHTTKQEHYYCISMKPPIWFHFQPTFHRWILVNHGESFKKMAIDTCSHFFYHLTHHNKIRLSKVELENVDQIMKTFSLWSFIDNLNKNCMLAFYNHDFETRLNQKSHLIAYENGVYDTHTQELRDGRPDDFISHSCNYIYDVTTEFESDRQQMMTCLSQLIENPSELKRCLKLFASLVFENYVHILIVDNDGRIRRELLELLTYALGDNIDRIKIISVPEGKAIKLHTSNAIYHTYKQPSRVDNHIKVINLPFPNQQPKVNQTWGSLFLSLLINESTCKNQHNPNPLKLVDKTQTSSLCDYPLFIKQTFDQNPASSIGLQLTYEGFKKWFISTYPQQKLPTRQQMKDSLETIIGQYLPSKKGGWKGYQFKDVE